MEAYTPHFECPYPDAWNEITDFSYDTPLELYRDIEAVKMANGKDADYILRTPYCVSFKVDGVPCSITIPAGMLTDLSSAPLIARPLIGRVGPHLEASILHDFLYIAWQDLPGRGASETDRAFADALFDLAMKEAQVNAAIRSVIYRATRLGGRGVYAERNENRYVLIPTAVAA